MRFVMTKATQATNLFGVKMVTKHLVMLSAVSLSIKFAC